mmetsp:Transcript_26968/g.42785  ORF Transcript_26968/g.42785 Transcript_26968/m.42785 type:complete len:253 (-) Transcript_26968:3151-3909(-)
MQGVDDGVFEDLHVVLPAYKALQHLATELDNHVVVILVVDNLNDLHVSLRLLDFLCILPVLAQVEEQAKGIHPEPGLLARVLLHRCESEKGDIVARHKATVDDVFHRQGAARIAALFDHVRTVRVLFHDRRDHLDTTKLSNEILDMRIGGQVPEQIAAVHFKVWFVEVLAHRLNEQVEILGVCELEHLVRVVRDARHELHGGNEARSFRARCIDHHERALKVPAVEHALQDPLVFRHSDGGAQSVSQVVPVE